LSSTEFRNSQSARCRSDAPKPMRKRFAELHVEPTCCPRCRSGAACEKAARCEKNNAVTLFTTHGACQIGFVAGRVRPAWRPSRIRTWHSSGRASSADSGECLAAGRGDDARADLRMNSQRSTARQAHGPEPFDVAPGPELVERQPRRASNVQRPRMTNYRAFARRAPHLDVGSAGRRIEC